MNYEDAFKHYREGTATEEEKAFVQEEIAKAKALSTLLDDEALAVKPAPIKEADAKEVKEAKHQLIWKRVLAGLLSIVALLVIIGAVLGGVFGSAATYAKDSIVYSKAEAAEIATEFAYNDAVNRFGFTGSVTDFCVMHIPGDLTDLTYELVMREHVFLIGSRRHPLVRDSCSSYETPRPFPDLRL